MIETALAVVRILTGVLLTVSAYGKFLQDYGAGVSDVLGYRIVRRPVAEAIAFALPVVEMLLAACLVLGLLLPASEVVAGVLLALLAGAAGSVLSRGYYDGLRLLRQHSARTGRTARDRAERGAMPGSAGRCAPRVRAAPGAGRTRLGLRPAGVGRVRRAAGGPAALPAPRPPPPWRRPDGDRTLSRRVSESPAGASGGAPMWCVKWRWVVSWLVVGRRGCRCGSWRAGSGCGGGPGRGRLGPRRLPWPGLRW